MASQSEVFSKEPWQVVKAAKEEAMSKGWKIQKETVNELAIRTTPSVRSLGETITITVVTNPTSKETSQLTITSSARYQAYTWGKTTTNVNLMLTGIRQRLGAPPPAPVTPTPTSHSNFKFCANCGKRIAAKVVFCPACGEKQDVP